MTERALTTSRFARKSQVVHTLPVADQAVVDRLVKEMNARWEKGERATVEDLLAEHTELESNAEAVIELVYEELCLRERHGDPESPERILRAISAVASRAAHVARLSRGVSRTSRGAGLSKARRIVRRVSPTLGAGARSGRSSVSGGASVAGGPTSRAQADSPPEWRTFVAGACAAHAHRAALFGDRGFRARTEGLVHAVFRRRFAGTDSGIARGNSGYRTNGPARA